MKPMTRHILLLAAAVAISPLARARSEESTSSIAFTDPAKPGTLKIRVPHGDITIHGEDVKEITIKSDSESSRPTPRKDGMRVLSSNSGYQLTEKDNVAVLDYNAEGWSGGSSDFDITVPRSTSVTIANSAHGEVECTGIAGDIDVRTMSGDVTLRDISGGALVETMSGEINVSVKSLVDSKPLSFTSMHGEITLRLPADAKANVRFRTHRGTILTNFDDKALVTRTEITKTRVVRKDRASADAPPAAPAPAAGAPDAPPAPPDAPPPSPAAPANDEDWRNDVRESVREAAIAAADATHEAAEAVREGLAEAHVEMSGMVAPLPPMTGGKVVAGKLNGGGTEIQAATLTGDIMLKKAE
jgi:hypothetical protein